MTLTKKTELLRLVLLYKLKMRFAVAATGIKYPTAKYIVKKYKESPDPKILLRPKALNIRKFRPKPRN
jgi:hypothetical protein